MLTAFLAIPFSRPFEPVIERVRSACETAGIHLICLQGRIPITTAGDGTFVQTIEDGIRRADLLIADLSNDGSEPNRNVAYELGIARGQEKPILILTRDDFSLLPSDLRQFYGIKYRTRGGALQSFERKLIETLRDWVQGNRIVPKPIDEEDLPVPAILSCVNFKGGVGKTTLAYNLAGALAQQGATVLLVDLDPQRSLTLGCLEISSYHRLVAERGTIVDVMREAATAITAQREVDAAQIQALVIEDCLRASGDRRADIPSFDLIAADLTLSEIEFPLPDEPNVSLELAPWEKIRLVDRALRAVKSNYDYIILDCPPNGGPLVWNAVWASDGIVIPSTLDHLSIQGTFLLGKRLRRFLSRERDYRTRVDLPLREWDPILGIAITRYSSTQVEKRVLSSLVNRQEMASLLIRKPVPFTALVPKTVEARTTVFVGKVGGEMGERVRTAYTTILDSLLNRLAVKRQAKSASQVRGANHGRTL